MNLLLLSLLFFSRYLFCLANEPNEPSEPNSFQGHIDLTTDIDGLDLDSLIHSEEEFDQHLLKMQNIFIRGKRKQNDPCIFNSQCASGLTCFRAFTSSSCQPSYSTTCFNFAFENIKNDTRNNLERELSVYANYTSIMENPEDTFKQISNIAVHFLQDILDFFNDFQRCAFDSPDFELPKGIIRSSHGKLVKVQENGRIVHDIEIFGFDLKLPKINLGLNFDLASGVGMNVYLGIMADFSKVDFNKVDIMNMDMMDLSSTAGDTRLGAFGNICSNAAAGLSTGFKFSGGLQYSNLTKTVAESAGEFADIIPELPGMFAYADSLPGAINFCTGYDLAAGIGIGNFFCGIGLVNLILGQGDNNYYFELGGNSGASVGGDVSVGTCAFRNYLMEIGVNELLNDMANGPSSW